MRRELLCISVGLVFKEGSVTEEREESPPVSAEAEVATEVAIKKTSKNIFFILY